MSTRKYAASHAAAHAFELVEISGFGWDKLNDLSNASSITRINLELEKIFGKKHRFRARVTAFFNAMLKIVDQLHYPIYSGTECRGWYRVFESITGEREYFSEFDWARDVWMAETFVKAKVVTEEQFNSWRTRLTLQMIAARCVTPEGVDIEKLPAVNEDCWDQKIVASFRS